MLRHALTSFVPLKVIASITVAFLLTLSCTAYMLAQYRATLMNAWRQETFKQVENAHHLILYYHTKSQDKQLSEEMAKKYALDSIKRLSVDKNGYFWVMDTNANMIQHPALPELEGNNLKSFVAADGSRIFQKMSDVVRDYGGGFVEYTWPKPRDPKNGLHPKVSYVMVYKPWDWVIGTGNYVDDINASFINMATLALCMNLAFFVFMITLSVVYSRELRSRKV